MRILGLDIGSKRIGVAVSDELGITAQGLTTIVRTNIRQDLERIVGIIVAAGVERIVVGYPLLEDGSAGVQCGKVDQFIARFLSVHDLPITRWDESFTTQEAHDVLRQCKVKGRERRQYVDKIAACLILQGYLNKMGKAPSPSFASEP